MPPPGSELSKSRLAPGEWVVLAFVAYAALRLVAAGTFTLNQRSIPRSDFVIVILAVMCARFLIEHWRTPWPPEQVGQRRMHGVFLLLLLGLSPAVFPPFPLVHATGGWNGDAEDVFFAIYGWSEVVLLVVLPILLFWLATARHIKAFGRLDTVGMVRRGFGPAAGVVRDWLPLLILLYMYGLLNPVIGKGLFGDQDATLARLDRLLFFGRDPQALCERLISAPLSVWLSACYVFYLPIFPLVMGWVFARAEAWRFREVAFALTLTFAVGYVGYTIVPAQGPLFTGHFHVSLDEYLGARLKAQLMDRTRVPRDCFPSLHTAGSAVLLWGAYRHARPLFWFLVPIVLSIPLACVYLRYHYVVDVLAGAALFVLVTSVTARSSRLQAAFRREA